MIILEVLLSHLELEGRTPMLKFLNPLVEVKWAEGNKEGPVSRGTVPHVRMSDTYRSGCKTIASKLWILAKG